MNPHIPRTTSFCVIKYLIGQFKFVKCYQLFIVHVPHVHDTRASSDQSEHKLTSMHCAVIAADRFCAELTPLKCL